MGRTLPLLIARAASIFLAGMLLFAVFAHAHAENLDGYGVKPLVPAESTADYGLKPMAGGDTPNGGFNAVPVGPMSAPTSAVEQAPLPMPQAYAPQAYAPQAYAPPASTEPYGYKPVPVAANTYTPAPQQPVVQQPVARPAAPGAYGYRSGDGMEDARPVAQAHGYYQGGQQMAAYQPSAVSRLNPGYVLGAGDKIKLTVFGEADLSGDFTIDGSGQLALPLIGQVRAAGYSAAQLEQAVGSALAQGYLKSPRVSVEVSTYRPFYIIGAVNRPGEYAYVNHMTALNAVALAGGFQNNAVESVVFVRREGSNKEEEMPADRTTAIYPGDVIRVHFTFLSDVLSVFSPLSGAAGIGIAAATVH